MPRRVRAALRFSFRLSASQGICRLSTDAALAMQTGVAAAHAGGGAGAGAGCAPRSLTSAPLSASPPIVTRLTLSFARAPRRAKGDVATLQARPSRALHCRAVLPHWRSTRRGLCFTCSACSCPNLITNHSLAPLRLSWRPRGARCRAGKTPSATTPAAPTRLWVRPCRELAAQPSF
jgi:hypothetical protein